MGVSDWPHIPDIIIYHFVILSDIGGLSNYSLLEDMKIILLC